MDDAIRGRSLIGKWHSLIILSLLLIDHYIVNCAESLPLSRCSQSHRAALTVNYQLKIDKNLKTTLTKLNLFFFFFAQFSISLILSKFPIWPLT